MVVLDRRLVDSHFADHLAKEEAVVFPAIRALGGPGASLPVRLMQCEHEEAAKLLRMLRSVGDNYRAPHDASHDHRVLLLSLEKLEGELLLHFHIENNVLFPRALAAAAKG